MIVESFKFSDIGTKLSFRFLGKEVFPDLLKEFNSCEKLILDFEGVKLVTNSFLDETLWMLIREVGFDTFKRKTTFEGLTKENEIFIKSSLVTFLTNLEDK